MQKVGLRRAVEERGWGGLGGAEEAAMIWLWAGGQYLAQSQLVGAEADSGTANAVEAVEDGLLVASRP